MGDRAGDNSQVVGLGEALGWRLEKKYFVYTRFEKIVNLPFCAHLLGVVQDQSSTLEGPWPTSLCDSSTWDDPGRVWRRGIWSSRRPNIAYRTTPTFCITMLPFIASHGNDSMSPPTVGASESRICRDRSSRFSPEATRAPTPSIVPRANALLPRLMPWRRISEDQFS